MKNNKRNYIELLAPAKDLECGIAAINYGADAVYIGGPKYGARAAVGNSFKDIEQLIKYAHKYWAKVYVTLNTILYDHELNDAGNTANELYNIGADALIIQDMAFLEMGLPPIPLFASTQTNNLSVEKIKFLQNVGFQRVILARELTLSQIKEIHNATAIDLEFFVHGALCVSYSGQCYFSHAISKRSANRGECLQACRMIYSLEDSKGKTIVKDKYLLSLKDLNLTNSLPDLIDAGISSFKIEGRLKDINYVKNVTAYFRKSLDDILNSDSSLIKGSSGKVYFNFAADINKTFNRGFTEYFVNTSKLQHNKIAAVNSPKSVGELLGKINFIDKDYFTIKTPSRLNTGDGLCYFDNEGVLNGFSINKLDGDRIYYKLCKSLSKGMDIYRNHDSELVKTLKNNKTNRKIDISISIIERDSQLLFAVIDEDNLTSSCSLPLKDFDVSENIDLSHLLEQQIKKTGNTIFNVVSVSIEIYSNYLIPVSVINNCRRNLYEASENNRNIHFQRKLFNICPNTFPFPESKLNYKSNIANKLSKQFYQRHEVQIVENGFELSSNHEGKEIMICKYCIKDELDICPIKNKAKLKTTYTEPLYIRDAKRKYQLVFDCAKCNMKIIY
ncbi:MAG: U32 family peptidase [Bacteroidota bacterium]|nr:U32 family peptidase [Bacteroidota bacterium]